MMSTPSPGKTVKCGWFSNRRAAVSMVSTAFGKFLADRAAVESFRSQIGLYLSETKGEPSPGHLGLHPEKALPH